MKNANEVQMNMNSPAAQAMCNTAAGADVRDCGFQIINYLVLFPLPFGYSGSTISPSLSLEP